MSKDLPYFKFFPSEWIMGKISFENYSIQGLFINACCHYWHQECNVKTKSFSKIIGKKNVSKLISLDYISEKNDRIHIDFLDEQYSELFDLHRIRVENGRKGGLSQAKAKQKPGKSIKDKEEDKDIDKSKKETKKKPTVYFEDDFLLNDKYLEWIKFRKEIKKPLTQSQITAQIKKLNSLGADTAIKTIDQSIENGWQGLFPLKETNQNGHKQRRLERFQQTANQITGRQKLTDWNEFERDIDASQNAQKNQGN